MSWSHRKGDTCKGWEKGGKPGRGTRETRKSDCGVCVGVRRERREKKGGSQVGGQGACVPNTNVSNKQQKVGTSVLPQPSETQNICQVTWQRHQPGCWQTQPRSFHNPTPQIQVSFYKPVFKGHRSWPNPEIKLSGFFNLQSRTLHPQGSNNAKATQQPRCSQTKWKHVRDRGHRPSFYPTPQLHLCVYLWVSCSLESSVHSGQLILTYKL